MPIKDAEARRKYQREWIAKRRADWLADKCCVQCGATENLHLDHIDPATKVTHHIWSWSASRRGAELAKCQVLCEPCHQNKTISDLAETYGILPAKCGTITKYNKYGCRCETCRAIKKVWNAKRNATVAQMVSAQPCQG